MNDRDRSRGMGFSFPLIIPLLADPLLIVGMFLGAGQWWGYIIHAAYFGLILAFAGVAASRTQWEKAHARRPTLTRANWILNWLLFFVILPLLLWLFFGLRTITGAPIVVPR